MLKKMEKFVNEILGDVLKRIREAFEKRIELLHENKKKISDLKASHLKEIYKDLVDTFRADFDKLLEGKVYEFKSTDIDHIIKCFVEPHIKWMYKTIKATYREEHFVLK